MNEDHLLNVIQLISNLFGLFLIDIIANQLCNVKALFRAIRFR